MILMGYCQPLNFSFNYLTRITPFMDDMYSVYLLPHFEKFVVLRRYGFHKSQLQHKLKIVSYCSVLNFVLTNCVNMYCFIRDFLSCRRNKEKASRMCFIQKWSEHSHQMVWLPKLYCWSYLLLKHEKFWFLKT